MSILVAVVTCPRPQGVSYVKETLEHIDQQLPDVKKLLICDRKLLIVPGWDCILEEHRRSELPDNKYSGWTAIRAAIEADSDLLFFEDDILPRGPESFVRMFAHEVPDDAAFTSFYSEDREPGFYKRVLFHYAQAMKIPKRTLEVLLPFKDSEDWGRVVGFDIAIAVAAKIHDWGFEQRPEEVSHVGQVSTFGR
jgi:hypothetical protein